MDRHDDLAWGQILVTLFELEVCESQPVGI
jgi:hypothetical protein